MEVPEYFNANLSHYSLESAMFYLCCVYFIDADSLDFGEVTFSTFFDTSRCYPVFFNDDPFYEDTESFTFILSFLSVETSAIIDPNVATITILDDDCKTTVKLFVYLEILGELGGGGGGGGGRAKGGLKGGGGRGKDGGGGGGGEPEYSGYG